MGIYIKGMSMPNRNESIFIEIKKGVPVVVGRSDTDGYQPLNYEVHEVKDTCAYIKGEEK